MSQTPVVWAVLPASGIGNRFGGELPKQYADLAGRTVIEQTLARVAGLAGLSAIYVATRDDDRHWLAVEAVCRLPVTLRRVSGGPERCHSVLNALAALAAQADPQDWVMVHDAVRPCVRIADMARLIAELNGDPVGGLLAAPVRDTMKRADAAGRVGATVEREGLWHAFTPQVFRMELLRGALLDALDSDRFPSDEAQAVEWAGHRPRLVEGAPDNLKITRPEDLGLAERILASQADTEPELPVQ